MKRLSKSIAGGVLIPLILVAIPLLVESCCVSVLRKLDNFGWAGALGRAYILLIAFPSLILPFPKSDSPDPNAGIIRLLLFATAILMDVFVYSLLTYAVLRRRERRTRLS
jgi:hypothetical protein